jgi:hypothetical protein
MVRPEPQPAWLHGSTPRAQTEGEWGIVRASMSSTTMRPAIGGRRILVVGAGIAGLGAARALHDLGYEVEVVEARERLGGRIWTVDRIDYGAHWIHGTEGNPITQLARMLELPTLFVGGDSTYTGGWQHIEFRSGGTAAFGEEEKRQSILAADELLERLDQWRERSSDQNGASVAEAVRAVQEANPQWSEEQRRHMAWHVELWSRDDCAGGAESLSARYWDEGYELYGDGDSVFWNGYQSLVEELANGLKVRLGCPVAHISSNGSQGSGVRLQTAQGELTADAVLVTLPLGVLQANAVTFEPPLPARRVEATARLGVGTLAKLAYAFDEVFWPRNQYVFGMVQDPARHPTMIVNLWSSHRLPCLMLLAGGSLGRELERMPEGRCAGLGNGNSAAMLRRGGAAAAVAPPDLVVGRSICAGRLHVHGRWRDAGRHPRPPGAGGRADLLRRRGDQRGALGHRPRRLPLGPPRGGTHLRHEQRAAAEDHHREPAVAAANAARRAVLQSPPQRPRPQAVVGAR